MFDAHGSRLSRAALARRERNGVEVIGDRLDSIVHEDGQVALMQQQGLLP